MKKTVFILYLLFVAAITTGLYHATRPGWIQFSRAERHFTAGRFEEAARLYSSLFDKGILVSEVYAHLADSFMANREFDKALLLLSENHRLTMSDKRLALTLASLYEAQGDLSDSEKTLRAILQKDPDCRNTRFYLARVLSRQKKYEESIKIYSKILGDNI